MSFTDCIVLKEVLHWEPVMPLGRLFLVCKHPVLSAYLRSIHNDIYCGMFIPINTMVMPNFWHLDNTSSATANPEVYYHPEFTPERFTHRETRLVLGFGRRICPGRHPADTSLWMAMVSLLWAFDFESHRTMEATS
ncbi:hypothetical protein BDN67DRAFT_1047579, partial [Paxillus ammoniavirescens]